MSKINHITPADGNIFEDLGLPEAENLKIRAELMRSIKTAFEASGLTQKAYAEKLGVSQPALNDVLKGKVGKCTIDRLVIMLNAIGKHVTLKVTRGRKKAA